MRFGMPVDPGNLLFLGEHAGRPVVGLPGCARSPALNGADWVLERLAAGIAGRRRRDRRDGRRRAAQGDPGAAAAARRARPEPAGRPRVAALVLAAGAARRMRGRDKLLEPVGRAAGAAAPSRRRRWRAGPTRWWWCCRRRPRRGGRRWPGSASSMVEAARLGGGHGGVAAGRAGARSRERAEAVVVLLADMPEVGAGDIDRLIAAFDPGEGREICRAVSGDGDPGHPVLFGRRFFEALAGLTGDRGAREVLREAAEFVTEVPTRGRAAVVDLDTPEEWAAWRAEGK